MVALTSPPASSHSEPERRYEIDPSEVFANQGAGRFARQSGLFSKVSGNWFGNQFVLFSFAMSSYREHPRSYAVCSILIVSEPRCSPCPRQPDSWRQFGGQVDSFRAFCPAKPTNRPVDCPASVRKVVVSPMTPWKRTLWDRRPMGEPWNPT